MCVRHFFGKVLCPRGSGNEFRAGLGIDVLQEPHSAWVCERDFPKIERDFFLREARCFLLPEAAKFGCPWSSQAPFQFENDCFGFFFYGNSEHLLGPSLATPYLEHGACQTPSAPRRRAWAFESKVDKFFVRARRRLVTMDL